MRPSSSYSLGITDLALSVPSIDLIDMERELIKSYTQSNCGKIAMAVVLAQMKQHWDTRNLNRKSKTFFCRYNSFSAYCKTWMPKYSDTQYNQLVKIGRAIAELTAQCQERDEVFILPASIAEAINLIRLPKDIRLAAWQAYKCDGISLPLSAKASLPNSSHVQEAIQTIRDNLPSEDLPTLIASLITPSIQEKVENLLFQKPSVEELSNMSLKAKKDLAQLFHLADYHSLVGQELDNYLIDRLTLVRKNT